MTTADEAEAERIAKAAVEERLAACANLLGAIKSVYWWEGKVCNGDEVALVFKTTEARKDALIDRVKQFHSYDCPCVLFFEAMGGSDSYVQWIHDSLE